MAYMRQKTFQKSVFLGDELGEWLDDFVKRMGSRSIQHNAVMVLALSLLRAMDEAEVIDLLAKQESEEMKRRALAQPGAAEAAEDAGQVDKRVQKGRRSKRRGA